MAPKQKIIWINKTAASKHLGRSEGTEKTTIFSHVQRTVHASSKNSGVSSGRYFPFRHVKDTNCKSINLPSGGERSDAQKSPIAEGSAIITSQRPSPHMPDPFCRIFEPADSPDSLKELTFLQFFREKTAVEWSGWYDKQFWQQIAPQLATSHPVVRHALVSLGAFHASFEMREASTSETYRALSLKQATKSIACFNRDYGTMSVTAVFISSIALTAMASCIDIYTFLQTMRVEFDLMEKFRSQVNQGTSTFPRTDWRFITEYLEPLIERQRSREGRLLDPIYSLCVAPAAEFYMSQAPAIPDVFDSLWQARQTLEDMLKWITYTAKTRILQVNEIPASAENLVLRWLKTLQDFRQDRLLNDEQMCSWCALRASCRMAVMMIRTMHAHSEMVFDQYLDVFREILAAFSLVLEYSERTSRINIRFGIDSGFVSLVTLAARCCRDPVLRSQLIASLVTAHRAEGGEVAYVAASTLQCYQKIEEVGINPPPKSSHDIVGHNRIRPFGISFYCNIKALQIRFLRFPYDPTHDVEEVWIPHVEDNTLIQYAAIPERTGQQPDFLLGRGFASYLVNGKASDYYTVRQCRFYFPIPRM